MLQPSDKPITKGLDTGPGEPDMASCSYTGAQYQTQLRMP